VSFLAGNAILKWIVLTFVMMAFLTRPYGQLTPSLCVNVFHTDAAGLGWAVAAVGAGGFGGALATAYFASRERKSLLWFVAGLVMSGGVFVLGRSTRWFRRCRYFSPRASERWRTWAPPTS